MINLQERFNNANKGKKLTLLQKNFLAHANKSKTVKLLGHEYKYKTISELTKKLNVKTDELTKDILDNVKTDKLIYKPNTGKLEKISLRDDPLIIRKFLERNVIDPKLSKELLIRDPFDDIDRHGNQVIIVNNDGTYLDDSDKINIQVEVKFWIRVSDQQFGDPSSNRQVQFNYIGEIKDLQFRNISLTYGNRKRVNAKIYDQSVNFSDVTDHNEFQELFDTIIDTEQPFNIRDNRFMEQLINKLKATKYLGIFDFDIFIYSIEGVTAKGSTFDFLNMKLRKVCYDNISINLFNEVIDIDNSKENCVKAFLSKRYPKLNVKGYFSKSDYDDGICTNDILRFCNEYKIKCITYDIEGKIIARNSHVNKQFKSLIYIAYNNHIYPLKNKLLKKQNTDMTQYKQTNIDKIQTKFNKLLDKHIIPRDIHVSISKNQPIVTNFVHDDICYHSNKDYNDCYQILKVFGIEDKMTNNINMFNLFSLLTELYNIPNYSSFCPFLNNYTIPGFLYHGDFTKEFINNNIKKIETTDKNKAYAYALYDLDYIYVFDVKYDTIIKNPTSDTNEKYVYIIEPEESSILIPKTGYYTGEDLDYFDSIGLKYKKLYEFEAKTMTNKFKQLIEDYYEKTKNLKLNNNSIIKNIPNIFIGKCERGETLKRKIQYNKVCNKDEASKSGTNYINLNDEYCASYTEIATYYMSTYKMIAIQVKNRCRRIVYEEMKRLNLTTDQIVQINTDSISYIKKGKKEDNSNIGTDFKSWKKTVYKKVAVIEMKVENESINIEELEKSIKHKNQNKLVLGYGGCGKSTSILNALIPSINKKYNNGLGLPNERKSLYKDASHVEDKDVDSYIILTPSHASLQAYRKLNKPCDVIQKYSYNSKLDSKIKIIIVDEIGMCDNKALSFLYKSSKEGITIYAYGDFNQLPPVDKSSDSRKITNTFLNLLFSQIVHTDKNYRNSLSISYYNQLINEEIDLLDEINKYSKKSYSEAEVIICYRTKIVDEYNNKVLKDKDMTMESSGCKVICKTNHLRDFGIYNNYCLEVVEKDKDKQTITLKDQIKSYTIPLKKYRKFNNKKSWFKPSYARTIYSLQGATINSYYTAPEDVKFFNYGPIAYTIISRLSKII